MLVTRDQIDRLVVEINEGFARQQRMITELGEKVAALEEKPKRGRPKNGQRGRPKNGQ